MALYTKLSRDQIARLAAQFGLPPPRKMKGILEGTVNTYYQLTTPDQAYFLKIDETADMARLKRELKVFKLLKKIRPKFFFQVPLPLKTKKGKEFVRLGKKFILLFEKIDGKTATIRFLKPSHLVQIGQALGELHKASIGFSLSPHRFTLGEMEQVYGSIQLKLKTKYPRIDLFISQWLIWLKKNEPRSLLPSGLIHADLFAENILFVGNRLNGIVDYEAAGFAPFLFDIAVSLHALCHDGKNFSGKKCRAFLKGYERVRRLSANEKKFFEYFLYQSAMRFLLTRLRDFELKAGPVKAKPFKDYREFLRRFSKVSAIRVRENPR